MKNKYFNMFGILVLISIVGCQSDEELRKVKHDIAQIQEQVYQIQNDQSELQRQLGKVSESLSQKIEDRREDANQQEKIYTMQDSISQLSAKIEDLQSVVKKQRNSTSSFQVSSQPVGTHQETEMPNAVKGTDLEIQFNTCFGDFNRGEYQLAALGFEDLIANYPSSPYSNECFYYLGRSYFELSNWQKAANNFGQLLKNSKDGNYIKPAMLYLGECYHFLNMPRKAVMKLKELQNRFPDSQESSLAKSFLRKNQYEQ